MPWYQVVTGLREGIKPAYVVVSGQRRPVLKMYVVDGGQRRLFYEPRAVQAWSDILTASESRSVLIRRKIARDEVASLSEGAGFGRTAEDRATPKTWTDILTASESRSVLAKRAIGRDETADLLGVWDNIRESEGASSLSVTFSSVTCTFDLAWSPDSVNQQEIYRCTGSACSPNTLIDTVPAGTSSYQDGAATTPQGTTVRYEIRSLEGPSNEAGDTKDQVCVE